MASLEEAIAAKDKFKEQFWKNSPEKYNVIGISSNLGEILANISDLSQDESEEEIVIVEDYFVVAYLFDINDAIGLPPTIDGIDIKYFPVIEKDEEKI